MAERSKLDLGNNEPESLAQAALAIAKGLLEERKERKEAIKEFARGFPILHQIIRYSEGLGYGGVTTKKWAQFSEVYADFMQIANLLYDKYEDEYTDLFGDHSREERIWFMMCDKMRPIVEDLNALVIALLPELKREIELRAESQERQEYIESMFKKPEEKKRPTYAEVLGGRPSDRDS